MIKTIPALCGSITGQPNPFGVQVHEAGYRALGLNYRYISTGTDDLASVVATFRALGFRGFGVSMPFKQAIIPLLDELSDEVKAIGACNTVTNGFARNVQGLYGENTDWSGALEALKEVDGLDGSSGVIIGCGGVARAIAYGLKRSGYRVHIAARNLDAARAIASDGVVSLAEQGSYMTDLIVNATPQTDIAGPVNLTQHPRAKVFLDVIGHCKQTPLTAQANSLGLRVALGWRMRLHQALRQFELYTGHPAPAQVMSDALEGALSR